MLPAPVSDPAAVVFDCTPVSVFGRQVLVLLPRGSAPRLADKPVIVRVEKICQTQQFFQYAISSDSVIDPTHHPCLHSLPDIFFKAMKGISAMVDAYLGKFVQLVC